ncbi:Heat shock factor binding protein [Gracilaria domingensis]|nr:Heat shock factor binding protein [Gracilaria domingensis]
MNSAEQKQAQDEAQPVNSTDIPSSPTVNDAEIESHRQIENDVQQLLSEMQSSFKSFSDNVFTQIDQMEAKISELDATLVSLSKNVEGSSEQRGSVSASPAVSPNKRADV